MFNDCQRSCCPCQPRKAFLVQPCKPFSWSTTSMMRPSTESISSETERAQQQHWHCSGLPVHAELGPESGNPAESYQHKCELNGQEQRAVQ